jgi:hypothetical protein
VEAAVSLAEARATEWRTAVVSERIRWDTPGHALAAPTSPDHGAGGCPAPGDADDLSIGGMGIGASGDDVRKLFGAPAAMSARELWDADALEHQRWDYLETGVSVSLVFEDAAHPGRVERVEVGPASSLKTVCGIGIGSTARDVSAVYGEGSGDGASRTVNDKQVGLEFVFKRGQVVMMRLGTDFE